MNPFGVDPITKVICPGCGAELVVVLDARGEAIGTCEYCDEAIAVIAGASEEDDQVVDLGEDGW
jgi:hypothetical protein